MSKSGVQLSYSSTKWAKIKSVRAKQHHRILQLVDGRLLETHRYACAGAGNLIYHSDNGSIHVKTDDGIVQVDPAYSNDISLPVGNQMTLRASISEITGQEQLLGYNALSAYHYKSQEGFGRKSVLVLTSKTQDWPSILGFIEITTPFMHLKCRNEIFDSKFVDAKSDVSWDRWDQSTRKENLHRIARISRVVVHPEVRGLGLSTVLLAEASKYCKERWHSAGKRALFLEITADMLKYLPFAGSAGFTYLGQSDGNKKRLTKDMEYLRRVQEKPETDRKAHSVIGGSGKGILSRQKRDLRIYEELTKQMSGEESTVSEIIELAIEGVFSRPDTVDSLLKMVREPKPVYMKGLSTKAAGFLNQRITELGVGKPFVHTSNPTHKSNLNLDGSLRINNLTISYSPDSVRKTTKDVIAVRRAFGLTKEYSFRTGVNDLSFHVKPGQIAFFVGASGSGKTSLLDAIQRGEDDPDNNGTICWPGNTKIGTLDDAFSSDPIITSVGAENTEHAMKLLGAVGLAEPRLYISKYQELSAGQKYRASLAKLMCSDCNVWVLDEFGSNLDDATLTALAKTFALHARRMGVIVLMASVRKSPVAEIVEPDLTVQLNQLGKSIMTYKDKNERNI